MSSTPGPLRVAFLGCGFITASTAGTSAPSAATSSASYASRDTAKAEAFCRRFGGAGSYGDYAAAIADPRVDAVVIAVPPRFHLELTLQALAAGKHVLVEKPAFLRMEDYRDGARGARPRAARVVLVGENDHYKPLAVAPAPAARRRRDRRDGVRALHDDRADASRPPTTGATTRRWPAATRSSRKGSTGCTSPGSLGPQITIDRTAIGRRRRAAGPDRRAKSMMVAFRYDNGAVGSLYYSREIPSLFQGLRLSKLFGRDGIITFESNGVFVLVRGQGAAAPACCRASATSAAIRRCIATSLRAIRDGRAPEMSLERAIEDQRLMDQIYASVDRTSLP